VTAITIQHELFAAIAAGNVPLIETLIREGAEVNFRANDPERETPLLRAIAGNDLAVVQTLLEAGANVNAAGALTGLTPTMRAVGKAAILRELLARGADVNARAHANFKAPTEFAEPAGKTVLHLASAGNHAEDIEILARAGADLEALDENQQTPLDLAINAGTPTKAAVALMSAGALVTPERRRRMHSAAGEPESYLQNQEERPRLARILQDVTLAKKFSQRPRPFFKWYLFFYFVLFGGLYLILSKPIAAAGFGLDYRALIVPIIVLMMGTRHIWKESNPICPGCGSNIRSCREIFCHVCGRRREEDGRCEGCGPAPEPLLLRPRRKAQDLQPISHCPECGAYLDAGLYRGYSRRRFRGLF
jgi:hypothetical protein